MVQNATLPICLESCEEHLSNTTGKSFLHLQIERLQSKFYINPFTSKCGTDSMGGYVEQCQRIWSV